MRRHVSQVNGREGVADKAQHVGRSAGGGTEAPLETRKQFSMFGIHTQRERVESMKLWVEVTEVGCYQSVCLY